MTAPDIEFVDYVERLRRAVLYVHPTGRAAIDHWLNDMFDAADHGDARAAAPPYVTGVTDWPENPIQYGRAG